MRPGDRQEDRLQHGGQPVVGCDEATRRGQAAGVGIDPPRVRPSQIWTGSVYGACRDPDAPDDLAEEPARHHGAGARRRPSATRRRAGGRAAIARTTPGRCPRPRPTARRPGRAPRRTPAASSSGTSRRCRSACTPLLSPIAFSRLERLGMVDHVVALQHPFEPSANPALERDLRELVAVLDADSPACTACNAVPSTLISGRARLNAAVNFATTSCSAGRVRPRTYRRPVTKSRIESLQKRSNDSSGRSTNRRARERSSTGRTWTSYSAGEAMIGCPGVGSVLKTRLRHSRPAGAARAAEASPGRLASCLR